MLVDYHTHHYRCGHATGQMGDYVEAALAANLSEIGLSDHSPIYHLGDDPHPRPATAMSQAELPSYIQEMQQVRDRYSHRITVRLGVESDYVLGWDEHYRRCPARRLYYRADSSRAIPRLPRQAHPWASGAP